MTTSQCVHAPTTPLLQEQKPKERYPGEWKHDERIRRERRAAGLRVKAQPLKHPPAIQSRSPQAAVVVVKP